MPAKKKTAKRTTRKSASKREPEMRSFKIEKDTIPFTSTKLTKQTAYWIVLVSVIVILQLWILKLQMDIATITELLLLP